MPASGMSVLHESFAIPMKQRTKAMREVIGITFDHRRDLVHGSKLARENFDGIEGGCLVCRCAVQATMFERRRCTHGGKNAQKLDLRRQAEFFFQFADGRYRIIFTGTQVA